MKSDEYNSFIGSLTDKIMECLGTVGEKGWLAEPDKVKEEMKNTIDAFIAVSVEKFDLVSRDEFDSQCRILARTRLELEKLEKKINSKSK